MSLATVPPAATRSFMYLSRSTSIALAAPAAGASSSPPMVGNHCNNLNSDVNGIVAREFGTWQPLGTTVPPC